jgi:Universal stress protein family
MMYRSASAVIVGVDGSQAAANAVRWAIDEAISRDVPLRIVHVAGVEEQPADDVHRKIEYAETALRAATAVVDATGRPLQGRGGPPVGTPHGRPGSACLVDQDRPAHLRRHGVCRTVPCPRIRPALCGSGDPRIVKNRGGSYRGACSGLRR